MTTSLAWSEPGATVTQTSAQAADGGLAASVLVELHDEWIAFPRRYLSIESMGSLYPDNTTCLPGTTE